MNSALLRTLIVYGVVLPVAVVVGWMLSTPLHLESLSVIGGVIFVLLLPSILTHHYAILIFSWNAFINAFFLPGKPYFWTLMVVINIAMMVMYRILQRRPMFISAPSLSSSVVLLFTIVLVTAKLRGGLGVRTLGNENFGGKNYFFVVMSLLGYFALASRAIEPWKIRRYTGLFYLSNITAVASNIIYFFPALYVLYEIFPSFLAMSQYVAEHTGSINRFSSFAMSGSGIIFVLLARFGLRGVLLKPRRIFLFIFAIAVSMFGGFRGALIFLFLVLAVLFVLEKLVMTKWTFVALFSLGASFAAIVPVADKMPRAVQRVLSFTPVKIDPQVRADAEASITWRLMMWAAVVPDMPKYFWLGKGYGLNPTDMFLAAEAVRRGMAPSYTTSLQVGDYHSGPLSIYMPFGFPGCVAFVLFLAAIGRALYLNNKYGGETYQTWNRFLFAFFIGKVIYFIFIFGSFSTDLATFTGVAGLSVALNRGICRYRAIAPKTAPVSNPPLGLAPSAA